MTRIIQVHMLWVGVHRTDLLPYLISRVREVDTVTKRLRHLFLTISTRQTTGRQILWQQDIGLYQHRSINLIKTAHQFTGHLQHRLLILTGRNSRGLKQRDIRSLRNWIAEETEGDTLTLETTHLHLSLHCRVALHTTDGHKVHQIGGQLSEFRYLTLDKEHTLLRIQSCSEIVERHLYNILADLFWIIGIIREGLHIGHKHEHTVIVTRILQLHTTAQ